MHPNPIFRSKAHALDVAFARDRAFGQLIVVLDGRVEISHVPFLLDADGKRAELHLVRSNPIARAVRDTAEATLVVTGPDGYVSPDWYGVPDQVPTWNYVAVHLRGRLSALPPDHLHTTLAAQSDFLEGRHDPKPRWTMDKMTDDARTRMMRQILPFAFDVAEIDGTWKLNQNKPDAVRAAAARHMAAEGTGRDTSALATLMQTPPDLEGS
jgi:transcriptional regulator